MTPTSNNYQPSEPPGAKSKCTESTPGAEIVESGSWSSPTASGT